MSDQSLPTLRNLLIARYDDLKRRLTRRLGCPDMASDALQDTYIRLEDKEPAQSVERPGAYLYRMAFHIAVDYGRSAERRLTISEADAVLDVEDASADPAQIVEGRAELSELLRVMDKMPVRRREILLAVRLDGVPQKELAERYGISLRLVERELQQAHAFCVKHMKRK